MSTAEIAVIVCPDRFVEKFSPTAFLPKGPRAERTREPRRHVHKESQMCRNCLFGHDSVCQSESCSCVCRENEPRFEP
jgi:hypothetical protein